MYFLTMERLQFTVAFMMASLLIVGACGSASQARVRQVRGLVVDVKADSLVRVDSLTIQDEEGSSWTFKAEVPVGFTPSHLREHQVLGQSVTVHYRETRDGLLVVSVMD